MRSFFNIREAVSEIRRDLSKSPSLISTRVQQRTDLRLNTTESLGYDYTIYEIPDLSASELVELGKECDFEFYKTTPKINLINWLESELIARRFPEQEVTNPTGHEKYHPALATTKEGNHYSYTYPERLLGMRNQIVNVLANSPDSRRAFWPIFQPIDAVRTGAPTRVPCSLGYEFMIRKVGGEDQRKLLMFYLERSCDFEHFWLSDVWFAVKLQQQIADELKISRGIFSHYIISLHRFSEEGEEIY